MYVNGLGFINENVYNINNTVNVSNAQNTNSTEKVSTSVFDDLLAVETAKLNNADSTKTYDLKSIFKEASEKYNVSYDLLTAIAWHESRFQPDVTSWAGAMGLMQLMPDTAKAMGVSNAYDPYENVMGAAKLLSKLSEMYDGDQTLTLAAYAAGTGSVAKYNGVPPYGETQEFVKTITEMVNKGNIEVPDKTVTSTVPNATNTENILSEEAANALATDKETTYQNFYNQTGLDNILSYQQYQMLMYYFENMLSIISNMMQDDTDTDTSMFGSSILGNNLLSNNILGNNTTTDSTYDATYNNIYNSSYNTLFNSLDTE